MRFFDYIRFAFKNLTRQKSRTILTIIAITVGSLSLILMASIIVSIKQSLTDQFKQLGAFDLVTVLKDPNSVNNSSLIGGSGDPSEGKNMDDTTLALMRQLPHVLEATPTMSNFSINTMKLEGQDKKTWASIMGYDPNNDVFNLNVAYGRKLSVDDMDKIVIGNRFIQDMGYTGNPADLIGRHVIFVYKGGGGSAPDWGVLPVKPPANADENWYKSQENNSIDIPAEIVGITKSGAIDDGQSYINIAWAKRLATNVRWEVDQNSMRSCQQNGQMQGGQTSNNSTSCNNSSLMVLKKDDNLKFSGYSSIILRADDSANITLIADAVKKLGYGANTAQAMLDQINKILLMVSIVLAVIGGISLFVAAIGIINTMIMATYERIREIGVMRACGATRATIRHLFTFEAAMLGFWGGIFGLLISLGLGKVAGFIVGKYGASLGSLPVDHIGDFPWWLMVGVIALTTFLGMISGLIPAIKAARLNPVEALRYE